MSKRHDNDGLRKVCRCKRRSWAKCDHPWHFNFKYGPTHFRFSLDRQLGRSITSKTEARAEADRLRSEIRAGRFGSRAPARDTLTVGQLLNTYTDEVLKKRPGGAPDHEVYLSALT